MISGLKTSRILFKCPSRHQNFKDFSEVPEMPFFSVSKLQRLFWSARFFNFVFSFVCFLLFFVLYVNILTHRQLVCTSSRPWWIHQGETFLSDHNTCNNKNPHIKTSTLSIKNTEKRYINQIKNVNKKNKKIIFQNGDFFQIIKDGMQRCIYEYTLNDKAVWAGVWWGCCVCVCCVFFFGVGGVYSP